MQPSFPLPSPFPLGASYCGLLPDFKHIPASGPWHLQFPLPGMFFFQIFTWPAPRHSGLEANVTSWEACPTFPGTLTRVTFPVPILLLRIQEGNLLHVKFGSKHILAWSFSWNVHFQVELRCLGVFPFPRVSLSLSPDSPMNWEPPKMNNSWEPSG